MSVRSGWPRPVASASSSAAAAPTYWEFPGWRKSAWASMKTRPRAIRSRSVRRRAARTGPRRIEQSPPRTSGNRRSCHRRSTRSARRLVYSAMAFAWPTPSPGRHVGGVESRRGEAPGVDGVQTREEPVVAKRPRCFGAAGDGARGGRAQSEVGGRVEDRDASRSSRWQRSPPHHRTGLQACHSEPPRHQVWKVGSHVHRTAHERAEPPCHGVTWRLGLPCGAVRTARAELAAGLGDGRVVDPGDGEQFDQALAQALAVLTEVLRHQCDQTLVCGFGLPREELKVGRGEGRVDAVRGRRR